MSDTYRDPTPACLRLKRWGLRPTVRCPECQFEWGTMGHIQGHCSSTKEAHIACHNKCRCLVTACLKRWERNWEFLQEYTCEETIDMVHEATSVSIPQMQTVSFLDPKTNET
eukprot:2363139-Rhodomonas_salina.1